MPDSKSGERTPLYYTMKTSAPKTPGSKAPSSAGGSHFHSRNNSLSHTSRHNQSMKTTTPAASPRASYSVGQSHPPKMSPSRAAEIPRSSSPNYFGLIVDSPHDPRESFNLGRNNWSPPSSSIKSFNATVATQVPLDANPEFEFFKRQVELNKGKGFALPTAHYMAPTPVRPKPPRWHTHASDMGSDMSFGRPLTSIKDQSAKMDVEQDSPHDSAYISADSKRNSETSLFPLQFSGTSTRYDSPRPMDASQSRTTLTRCEDRDPRLSIMECKVDPPMPTPGDVNRASTLPLILDSSQPAMISGEQLKSMIKNMDQEHMLLLDIRSSQNYAQSRVKEALNLCIPTTLLKRATFNIEKLQQTFSNGQDFDKFSRWRDMRAIVVYDSHSSDKRDAITAQNMIKKFTSEGFSGETCILRGGFTVFQESFGDLVDRRSGADIAGKSSSGGLSLSGGLAPVIGGVMLPTTNTGPNPFFANIRQNMDLADGVGQFEVSRPSGLESSELPAWLREAASASDKGKIVSDKFLNIEREEKARMQSAYAAFNPKTREKNCVQISGVEKGGKNRYKDILPFEHARVKLQKPEGSCDYVNASHLSSSRSNKRYIASQGPLPTTFDDFWSVIWEQDVRVIVMLTAESEGGQLKCHSYWKERDYGSIKLKPLSEKKASLDIDKQRSESMASTKTMGDAIRKRAKTITNSDDTTTPEPSHNQSEAPYVLIRKFALSHAAHPFAPMREITQLHFSAWPDFGTPAQPSHLLALVELANVMQRSALPVETAAIMGARKPFEQLPTQWYDEPEGDARTRPMLVHCSAGCGRTGTFCAVDSVVDMLKRQRQAKTAAAKQDAEGDVLMKGNEDVDPFAMQMGAAPQLSWPPMAPKDTSFVFDETVDLIQKTVDGFRKQRLSMVQSLRQFVLCYETILEWVHRTGDGATPKSISGRARSESYKQAQRE